MTDSLEGARSAGVLTGSPEAGQEARLRASFCPTCVRWEFPALGYCPTCDHAPVEQPLSSSATVRLVSAVLHQPPGALIEVPYTVVLADFPEGLSVLGVVPGVGHDEIEVGETVTTVAAEIGGALVYQYRLDRA